MLNVISSSSQMLSSISSIVSLKGCLINEIYIIYKDTILTEEQIKALHDFFARRYNIETDPAE